MKQPYHSFCCPAVTHKLIIGREESIYIGHTKFRGPKTGQGDWTLSTGRLFSLQTIIPPICPSIHPWAYLERIFCWAPNKQRSLYFAEGNTKKIKAWSLGLPEDTSLLVWVRPGSTKHLGGSGSKFSTWFKRRGKSKVSHGNKRWDLDSSMPSITRNFLGLDLSSLIRILSLDPDL